MPIYMEIEGMTGSTTAQGFDNMTELNSFQWGVARSIGTAASGSTLRESSIATVSDITVSFLVDQVVADLENYAVFGKLDKKFTIHFTTTTAGQTVEYLKHECEKVGVSHFSLSSGGDLPMISMSLNFTKLTSTYTPMDPSVTGNNKIFSVDLTTLTGSAS